MEKDIDYENNFIYNYIHNSYFMSWRSHNYI